MRIKYMINNIAFKHIDLRDYDNIIIDIINEIAPNKNPIVNKKYFITDRLTKLELFMVSRALENSDEFKSLVSTW